MIKRRFTSIIVAFLFLVMTTSSAFNTISASAAAPAIQKSTVPIVTFLQKPQAEYVAGSNVNYKVTTKTSNSSTKIQYSAKLFNLTTNKKDRDISNYGTATLGAKIVTGTFLVQNPGNYRLAVYVKLNGTKGSINNYYDNYVTCDFRVIKLDKVTKTLISVDPIVASVDERSSFSLPTTVNGKMSDNSLNKYGVTWDKPVNTTTPGAYSFVGTLKDLTTSAVVKNVTAKLSLKVNALPVFDSLVVTVDALSEYTLPTTVDGKLGDGTVKTYGVTWDRPASTTTPGAFIYIGTIKDQATSVVVKNVNPRLTLKVNALPVIEPIVVSTEIGSTYTLPTSVSGKLPNGEVKQYEVTWDKPLSTKTPGVYVFNGTIKNLTTSAIIKNVTPKVTVTVNDIPSLDSIVAGVDQGTDYTLPTTLSGKLSDGTFKQYKVTWDKPVNTTTPGAYTFIGTLMDQATSTVLKSVSASLTLTVKAVPKIDPIVINVTEGTPCILPTTVYGKMYDGTTNSYNVTWDKQTADTSKVGSYNFLGTLKDAKTSIQLQNTIARLTLNVNALQLRVLDTSVAAPNAFKVIFNKPINNLKCNVTASINGINIPLNSVWNNDATTVLLQAQGDLPIGSYILKVSGIDIGADTFQVEVKPLTLTSVYIPTAYISPNNAAARIMITGKDQYGQDYNVASSDFIWIINDTVSNINLQPTTSSNSYLTVQTNLSAIRAGDKISVYCMGKTNILLTATTTLEVNTKPINNIVLVQPILPAGDKRLIVKTVDTYYEIPYEAVQDYTLNGVTTHASALLDDRAEAPLAQTVTLNNFIFSTDRSDVITSIKVEGGRLFIKLAANASGTVKLNATQQPDVGQSTTQNINTLTLNIAGPAMPDSFTYTDTKAVLVTGGSINKLPITVYDQYGEVVTPDAFARSNFSDFTILSSNTGIATAAFGIDGKTLNITPVGVGQANITIVNRNSGKTILYTATVNPASIVKDFVSTVDYTTITKGASANLKIDTLDQYGNKLSSAGGTYKYLITAVNGSTNVKISTTSAGISIIASSVITLTGMTAGRTEAITVNLYNDGNNNNKIDANELIKTNAFYINIVADNEPLVYTVNPTNTVYAAVSQDGSNSGLTEDAYGAVQNQNNKNLNYAVKLTMSATKNDGTPVALASNPIKSVNATVNQGIIDFMGKSGNDFVIVGKQWSGSELTKDAILQIYFVDNSGAIRTINAKVTVSKESLKATKLRFMANVGRDNDETSDTEVLSSVVNITAADFYNLDGKKIIENQSLTGVSNYFEVDDQYGVSSFNPVNVSIIGKQTANGVFTMDSSGIIKTNGFLYGDSITLSATDTEGHNLIITLKLQ